MSAALAAMAHSLRHRGPDGAGEWLDREAGIALGHRRLSIIDLSPEGRQPMVSRQGKRVITFNGEIYNYLDLKTALQPAKIVFRGHSDTEVLLAAIDHWGLNQTLQKINGMFAFALWDKQARALHFARDRMGKKPLYIGWAGKALVFGSELKALSAHPDFKAEINPESAALYMRYGYVPAPRSIYKGVWTLPAGHRLSVTPDLAPGADIAALMEPYWNHREILEESRAHMVYRSDAEATDEFEKILSDCVRARMISDVPLGAFLSGGIDSTAVAALMRKFSNAPIRTFTIGFHEAGFDEAAWAKKIAAHLGTEHHELYLTAQDAQNVIPRLPEIYDEPFADISAIPTYLVAKFAREKVTVALTGDGGDEMLGGYNRHIAGAALWKRARFIPGPLRRMAAGFMETLSAERWDALFPARPHAASGARKVARMLASASEETAYESFLIQGADSFLRNAPSGMLFSGSAWTPLGLEFSEKMMYLDALSYLPNDILVKVDRASMAASLEARAPLLDKRIYEYAWSLPLRHKIRNGKGKWILRQVLKKYVPEFLFERPKQGFAMPAGEWLRGPLRDWAEELLNKSRIVDEGFFDEEKISRAWRAHLSGNSDHTSALWTVLMFQAWKARRA